MMVCFLSERAGIEPARSGLLPVVVLSQRCWRVETGANTECRQSSLAAMHGAAVVTQLARPIILLRVMLVLIASKHCGVVPWRIGEKGAPKQTGTLIECWHGSSGHRNQTRKGLLIGRRDAILRGATQLRSVISPAADPSPGRRFGFYRLVMGRPLACNGLLIR